jgi:hypothetical protein
MPSTLPAPIRFQATLCRPKAATTSDEAFLVLPPEASAQLPSRGMVAVEGVLKGVPFAALLEPDGRGGHWFRVEATLRASAGVAIGDRVPIELAPAAVEPEPAVPPALQEALAAHPKAQALWATLTPRARRDWALCPFCPRAEPSSPRVRAGTGSSGSSPPGGTRRASSALRAPATC